MPKARKGGRHSAHGPRLNPTKEANNQGGWPPQQYNGHVFRRSGHLARYSRTQRRSTHASSRPPSQPHSPLRFQPALRSPRPRQDAPDRALRLRRHRPRRRRLAQEEVRGTPVRSRFNNHPGFGRQQAEGAISPLPQYQQEGLPFLLCLFLYKNILRHDIIFTWQQI
jgi:hypothetical protein